MNTVSLKGTCQIKSCDSKVLFSRQFDVNVQGEEYSVREIKLAPGAFDVLIDFGGVSDVKFFYLESSKPIIPKINGNVTGLSTGKIFLLSGTDDGPITSVLVSNPNSEEVSVSITLLG